MRKQESSAPDATGKHCCGGVGDGAQKVPLEADMVVPGAVPVSSPAGLSMSTEAGEW